VQSRAKNRAGKTGKGNPYLKAILGEAAVAAARREPKLALSRRTPDESHPAAAANGTL
jgi:hypothetical protein